jgi:tRNA (guanine10-N2)-dimethyltransferase
MKYSGLTTSVILLAMQTLIIHGRQPALGRAELESLYGADILRPVGDSASLLDIEPTKIDFMRLGGMVKFCKVLTVLDTTKWDDIEKFLVSTTPQHFSALPAGKLKIGLSVYGIQASPKRIQATALEIKKAGKSAGRSIRIVPNKEAAMNSAQVLHNKLTQKLGWELVFVRDGEKTILAQSIAVQDIDAYAARDQQRPYRDTRVGMLPPKLAQIILNLANYSCEKRLLDPFCGTGVLLQEAWLMGGPVLGTDIEPRMTEYSRKNLDWLIEKRGGVKSNYEFYTADATTKQWDDFQVIACETYLGRALSSLPDPSALNKIVQDCDTIHKKFLKNVARQTKPGLRMCIAVPAWKKKDGFVHLPTLEKLTELGYTRLSFESADEQDLIYHRPDQTVARELVVLIRK